MTRKLHNDGRLIDIDDRLPLLNDLFASMPQIVAVYVYGSYGTADQTPLSDVDLAVLFRRGAEPSFEDELRLIGQISEVAQEEDISFAVLNRLPTSSKFQIIAEGRLLYLADPVAHADFMEAVFDDYGDYEPVYRRFTQEYDASLWEAYGNDQRDTD